MTDIDAQIEAVREAIEHAKHISVANHSIGMRKDADVAARHAAALTAALATLEAARWRPIADCPADGPFMAWNDAWDEPLKVHKWTGHGKWNVCHGYTGKLWHATHWRPLPEPPAGGGG